MVPPTEAGGQTAGSSGNEKKKNHFRKKFRQTRQHSSLHAFLCMLGSQKSQRKRAWESATFDGLMDTESPHKRKALAVWTWPHTECQYVNNLVWKCCPEEIPYGLTTVETAAATAVCIFNDGCIWLGQMQEAVDINAGRSVYLLCAQSVAARSDLELD